MILSLIFALFISPAHAESEHCRPDERNAAKLSCGCIRERKKSTVYVKGQRLPYVNSIAYCSDRARPELIWIPRTADIKNCPVIDCHEPEDP